MITMRRAAERHHARRLRRDIWLTFRADDHADPLAAGFGVLQVLNETLLPPGAAAAFHPHHEAEVVSYVLEGALAYEDSTGRAGVIRAGEFERRTTGRGVRYSETNPSRTDWTRVFQMALQPSRRALEPRQDQKRFSAAQRSGLLCAVASPDGRAGSLRIDPDVVIYSALLAVGQHLVHELAPGRCGWLHVVRGEVALVDAVLTSGDGAGVAAERVVSLTAREETELLLLDLAAARPLLSQSSRERD